MTFADMMAPDSARTEIRSYAFDLHELAHLPHAMDVHVARASNLAYALAGIHHQPMDPSRYRSGLSRALMVDLGRSICAFEETDPVVTPAVLEAVEQEVVRWRWRLSGRRDRARRIHGRLTPEHILFQGRDCVLSDMSRDTCGEPAEDIAMVLVHHVAVGLSEREAISGGISETCDAFLKTYLSVRHDENLLKVLPPFLAVTTLAVLAPGTNYFFEDARRRRLLRFAERTLTREGIEAGGAFLEGL